MSHPKFASDEIDHAYQSWAELQTLVRQKEHELAEAIALYPLGRHRWSLKLLGAFEQLRAECARQLQAHMAELRRIRATAEAMFFLWVRR